MGKDVPGILILDASVLINFLAVDRMDLMMSHPAHVLITEHVRVEVREEYPEQLARLERAITDKVVEVFDLTAIPEMATMIELRSRGGKKRMGIGEASAIAAAIHRNYDLAIDDKPAIKQIRAVAPKVRIHTTSDLIVQLIKAGLITVEAACRPRRTASS